MRRFALSVGLTLLGAACGSPPPPTNPAPSSERSAPPAAAPVASASVTPPAPPAPATPPPNEVVAPPAAPFAPVSMSCADRSPAECYLLATHAFALDVHRLLAKGNGNLILSPPGLMAGSASVWLGARGATAETLGRALHLDELSAQQLPQAAAPRRWAWQSAGAGTELQLLQMIVVDRSVQVDSTWAQRVQQAFGARIQPLDIQQHPEQAIAQIDAVAALASNGRIPHVIELSVPADRLRVAALSSVYFKGAWKYRFDPSWTRDDYFTTLAGSEERVRMMRLETKLLHERRAEDRVETIELPYANGRLGLVIVLPDAADGLPAVEARLSLEALERWVPTHLREADVWLPRVHTSSRIDLREPLAALGVHDLFSPAANLSGMGQMPDTVGIDQAEHRCTLEISEEGTVATSITTYAAVDFGDGHPPNRPVVFRVDHPFLFFIRDRQSGAILFLGRVTQPGYEPPANAPAVPPPPGYEIPPSHLGY